MQTTTPRYRQLAGGHMRPISSALRVSFEKNFEAGIGFFILDTSLLDGTDVLAPSDIEPVQLWDKYDYVDYSKRVVDMEWEREEDIPSSVSLAIADITLNNYDGLFTKGEGGPLEDYLLPRRPIRILGGFGTETLPQFVGLTQTTPEVDYKEKTATVHCVDFLSSLFDKPLDQTVMLENVTTDVALDELFQQFGLLAEQYSFDLGSNLIKFVYFEKGTKLGTAVRELVQAELGSFYMDELGVIRFKNSKRDAQTAVMTFDKSNIEEFDISNDDNIINVVEIIANVRSVQAEQPVYRLSEPIQAPAGSTEAFLSLPDPITTLNPAIAFTANSLEDGTGTDLTGNVSITDIDQFATAVKLTFNNAGASAYIRELVIDGTPAKATGDPLYVRMVDQDSVDKYEEQVLTIENDFIQSQDSAESVGLSLLYTYSEHANTIDLTVKGAHSLQLRDVIHVNIDDVDQDFTISKIQNQHREGYFKQRLIARAYNLPPYFILSSDSDARSLLDGTDLLAP